MKGNGYIRDCDLQIKNSLSSAQYKGRLPKSRAFHETHAFDYITCHAHTHTYARSHTFPLTVCTSCFSGLIMALQAYLLTKFCIGPPLLTGIIIYSAPQCSTPKEYTTYSNNVGLRSICNKIRINSPFQEPFGTFLLYTNDRRKGKSAIPEFKRYRNDILF